MTKFAYLIAGLAFATSLPALAAPGGDAPSMRVQFADLDLRSDAGVERLDSRLRRAISEVCGDGLRGGFIEMRAALRCKAATLADVTPKRDAVIRLARNGSAPRVARLDVKAIRSAN